MDARTGVDREPRPVFARENAAKGTAVTERRNATDPIVAGAESAIPTPAPSSRGKDAMARLSPDPMRATDRYRLVMPWSARV